jgi:hypothetical protein
MQQDTQHPKKAKPSIREQPSAVKLSVQSKAVLPDLAGGCAFGPFGAPKGQRNQENVKFRMRNAKCKSGRCAWDWAGVLLRESLYSSLRLSRS